MNAPLTKQEPEVRRSRSFRGSASFGAVILATVSLLGLVIFARAGDMGAAKPGVGAHAPDFSLPDLNGRLISLDDYEGTPVWVTFWASWCPPCRDEMPDLDRMYGNRTPDRFGYLAVSLGEDSKLVERFMEESGYRLPVLVDPAGALAIDYRVVGLPTHFFIDSEGIVKEIYAGPLDRAQMEERAERLW